MRQLLSTVFAAAFGAIFGTVVATNQPSVRASPAPTQRLETKELVLINEANVAVARLATSEGMTVLRFVDDRSNPLLELGVQQARGERFLRLYGQDGKVLAAINSSPPNGETTLYLGDERWGSRIILGALRTDLVQGKNGVEEWGLQFRRPGSSGSLFNVLVTSASDPRNAKATLRLNRPDGTAWVK